MGFSKLADLDKHVGYSIRIGNTAAKFLTATTMAEIDLGRRKPSTSSEVDSNIF
jgi:hypothetical protein